MKRLSSFQSDESTESSGKSMKEVSSKIRAAGAEEEQPNPAKPGAEKPGDPAADPAQAQPGEAGAPTGDGEDIIEPAPPVKKTPEEMAMPPEAFTEPESETGDPVGESNPPPAPAEQVNQDVVDEMGGGSLNEHLKGAFSDFLDGKKPGQPNPEVPEQGKRRPGKIDTTSDQEELPKRKEQG
jgi:cell pole-organizing protein PopZ